MRQNQRRTGISLVEVLVAVAIAGIIIALALPAIQQLREAARNQQCGQRLTQIGLKAQVYEISNGRLPSQLAAAGAVQFSELIDSNSTHYYASKQLTSPLGLIANMEGQGLRLDAVLFDFDTYELKMPAWNFRNWYVVNQSDRSEFLCPSEINNQDQSEAIVMMQPAYTSDPLTEDTIVFLPDASEGPEYGHTNFVGMMGASSGGAQRAGSDFWKYRGMIATRESVTSADVADSDGLANTLMFGENIGTIENGTVVQRHSWLSGAVARGRGMLEWASQGTPEQPLLGRAMVSSAFGFGSGHKGGVNFVRGDASIQTIARDIDWQTYYDLCGAFDTD